MQPQKLHVHKTKLHKGSQSFWTGSHTETRVVMGTQDLHPNAHKEGRMQLDVGPEIYSRHQGTQAGKTISQRSLTIKWSLATVGGLQKYPCESIRRAIVHQYDTKISQAMSTIPGHCI